ncbi:hypothetical protein FIU85_18235 [Roseovarius sp. THAF8]|uniref:hypothetical protein n=1 Tax=Roseovarius sp. THAF8 TaxID=2587846 RepID=UPI00126928B6|nr:hypothetical protein [Roseovarius sp. THAF8]QFT99260.1 hypothetical protein FIU85_18235 [Roseovarius sp. THAF8]
MSFQPNPAEARFEKRNARALTARKWARGLKLVLAGLCLTAIWQERALYPVMHDRMQAVYVHGMDWIERMEGGSSYLTAMGDFGIKDNSGEHDALTRALLNMRQ